MMRVRYGHAAFYLPTEGNTSRMQDDEEDVPHEADEVVVSPDAKPCPPSEWEEIRCECDRLTALETIDKNAALRILKMYHNMETLVHELRRQHAQQIEDLNTRFLEYRLRNEQAERIVHRVDAIEKTLDAALQETRTECKRMCSGVEQLVAARFETMPKGKR